MMVFDGSTAGRCLHPNSDEQKSSGRCKNPNPNRLSPTPLSSFSISLQHWGPWYADPAPPVPVIPTFMECREPGIRGCVAMIMILATFQNILCGRDHWMPGAEYAIDKRKDVSYGYVSYGENLARSPQSWDSWHPLRNGPGRVESVNLQEAAIDAILD